MSGCPRHIFGGWHILFLLQGKWEEALQLPPHAVPKHCLWQGGLRQVHALCQSGLFTQWEITIKVCSYLYFPTSLFSTDLAPTHTCAQDLGLDEGQKVEPS